MLDASSARSWVDVTRLLRRDELVDEHDDTSLESVAESAGNVCCCECTKLAVGLKPGGDLALPAVLVVAIPACISTELEVDFLRRGLGGSVRR